MSATPHDNLLRYHVDSGSRSQVKHLVDLDLYDRNGACSCEHFTFNLEKHLKSGLRANPGMRCKPGTDWWNVLRCHHIREARDKLADDVIRRAIGNGTEHFKADSDANDGYRPPKRQEPAPEVAFQPAKAQRPIPPPRKKGGKRETRVRK